MNQTCAQKSLRVLAAVLFAAIFAAGIQSARAGSAGALEFSSSRYRVKQTAGSVSIRVTRVHGSSGAVSVGYWTQAGTARAGQDYTYTTGTLRWSNGDSRAKTFSVHIDDATGFSGTKMFHILLAGPVGASIGRPGETSVVIQGSDTTTSGSPATLSLSASSYAASQSAGSVPITVDRTGSSSGTASVAYSTTSGTAAAGTNFTSTSGTLQWASGDSSPKTFTVAIGTTPFSGSKTFGVALSDASTGASIGNPSQATVTISGTGTSSGGTSSGSPPTNVMVIRQGTDGPDSAAMFSCGSATAVCPGFSGTYTLYYGNNQNTSLNEIGWKGISGATNYAIYRATNGGAATLLATISASTAQSNYGNYVSTQSGSGYLSNIDSAYTDNSAANVVSGMEYPPVNVTGSVTSGSNVFTVGTVNKNTSVGAPGVISAGQGISGPGIPTGTTIAAFGSGGTTGRSGAGTYQLSQSATTTESGRTYGTQYFPNTSYTYYVEAEVGGVWSSRSAYATLPYVVNGEYILSGGVFGGPAEQGAAPATTPLGYSKALEWAASSSSSVIGIYAGNSAADQALNVGGYSYLNVAFYTSTAGINFTVASEVPGDNVILGTTPLSAFGFGSLTPNAWTTYKIPLSDIYIDKQWSGSLIQQNSLYKLIFQYDYGAVSSTDLFMEMWFSVN